MNVKSHTLIYLSNIKVMLEVIVIEMYLLLITYIFMVCCYEGTI
jgi:hypothetical protein